MSLTIRRNAQPLEKNTDDSDWLAIFDHNFVCMLIVGLLLLLTILGCALEGEEETLSGDHTPHDRPKTNSPKQLSLLAEVQPRPEPHKYQVRLTWNFDTAANAWVIQREDSRGTLKQLATLAADKREFNDMETQPGETYRYELTSLDRSEQAIKAVTSVQIPKDLEIKTRIELSDLKGIKRLFLRPGAILSSLGRSAVIEVDEIISDDGVVETLPEGQTAPPGGVGRPGGELRIRARTGRGILNVYARGETGGQGAQGPASQSAGIKGPRGSDGACGREDEGFRCNEVTRHHLELVRNDPRRSGMTDFQRERYLQNFHCRIQTGHGGQGGVGAQGGKGAPGHPGGDSALVLVVIDEPAQIQVRPHPLPGAGGAGGNGGAGGPGGPGGDPGNQDHLGLCRTASTGPQGPQGPHGPQGELGPRGKAHPFCVRLGPTQFGDCDHFPQRAPRS